MGLAVARYGVRVEPVASAGYDDIVAWAGPIVQSLLDGDPSAGPGSGMRPSAE
ncbi:hypothetical protein GCM10010404_85210 [Nonomuraea africana]|uniref:Tetracyclin repressor-like C-terminal domain-containing protein n=1 Tax=Nonomuraea africana TaxID=46171 RepID=A0ABR9KEH7_9ACTN|nr:hypothetical protein [Nonomuraea africana]MBE1560439.1 hypothetical protein [Nonomuraea africana]